MGKSGVWLVGLFGLIIVLTLIPVMLQLYNSLINPTSWATVIINGPLISGDEREMVSTQDNITLHARICVKDYIDITQIIFTLIRKSDSTPVDRKVYISDEHLACRDLTLTYAPKQLKPDEYNAMANVEITNKLYKGEFFIRPYIKKFYVENFIPPVASDESDNKDIEKPAPTVGAPTDLLKIPEVTLPEYHK